MKGGMRMAKVTMKAARINANLTQKDAAEIFGVSNKTLSKWENGISFPGADKIPLICKTYRVPYNDIIFLINNPL